MIIELLLLKPCCMEICGMLFVMYGSSVFSSVFAITERSEMGLYDVPMFMSLFGFGIGMMFASFHVWWMMLLFSDILYMLVRYASPCCIMCLRCLMLTVSCPVELLFLLCLIATWTCVVVSVILFVCSLCVFLFMCLFVLCLLCLTVLVNCLLNVFAICVGEVNVFSLVVIVLCLGCAGFFWLIRVWSSKEYVCYVCGPSVCLCVHSICQMCVFV